MENKNIILTDVKLHEIDLAQSLFYTGMTRSTENLYVLCDEKSEGNLFEWLGE